MPGALTKGYCWFVANLTTYATEVLGRRRRVLFCPVSFAFTSLSGVTVNVLSLFVSHYRFYIYLNLVMVAVSSVFYLYLIESPFFFYKRKDIRSLYQTLLAIGSKNHPRAELPAIRAQLQAKLRYACKIELVGCKDTTGIYRKPSIDSTRTLESHAKSQNCATLMDQPAPQSRIPNKTRGF